MALIAILLLLHVPFLRVLPNSFRWLPMVAVGAVVGGVVVVGVGVDVVIDVGLLVGIVGWMLIACHNFLVALEFFEMAVVGFLRFLFAAMTESLEIQLVG